MPTLGTLAAGIKSVAAVRRSEVYLTELDGDDLPLVAGGATPQWRKLQYFPESFSDTKQVNYQTKDVPGGSVPLRQYTSSGDRIISFRAEFTTDVDHLVEQQSVDFDGPSAESFGDMTLAIGRRRRLVTLGGAILAAHTRLKAAGAQERNPFIPGALIWLRRFMFPRYGENAEIGVPITKPPHKILLHIVGTEFERFGGDGGFSVGGGGVLCVMTQCDITVTALFPSGNIRCATVDLSFAEVAQRGGVVRFPSCTHFLDYVVGNWYPHTANSRLPYSG